MKIFNKIKSACLLTGMACLFFTACNKAPLPPTPLVTPSNGTTPTLATLLDAAEFSFLKAAVTRAGLLPTLSSPSLRFTVFAPNDAAFIASGIPSIAVINALPLASVVGLVSYHVVPQVITSGVISTGFPNMEYPSVLNPTTGTPAFNPLVRLTTFPSRRGAAAWANNVPITAVDVSAVNGVLHKVALLVAPPSQYLWDGISTSSSLTYLKAAIIRADSGVAVGGQLQTALSSFGTNLTLFAPTDLAFQQLLTGAIYQGLVAQGMPPAQALLTAQALAASPTVFSNPALYGVLTAQTVRGIIVYHILGTTIPGIRVFSVNLPTSPTAIKTLLNQAVAVHPGVTVQATFGGPFVAAATVKGIANATASKVIINPANPLATDLHYVNGVIMVIDQVLLPQ